MQLLEHYGTMFVCVELEEDWYHSDDPINAGISFYVKVIQIHNHCDSPLCDSHQQSLDWTGGLDDWTGGLDY